MNNLIATMSEITTFVTVDNTAPKQTVDSVEMDTKLENVAINASTVYVSDIFFWLIVDDVHNDNAEYCVTTNDEHEPILDSSVSLPDTIQVNWVLCNKLWLDKISFSPPARQKVYQTHVAYRFCQECENHDLLNGVRYDLVYYLDTWLDARR